MAGAIRPQPCLPIGLNPTTSCASNVPSTLPRPQAAQVILILGEPSPVDIHPLIMSSSLARCLLVIATHKPPRVSCSAVSYPGPDVRILRLSESLAAHDDSGAVRLVGLFERAGKVARLWRESSVLRSPVGNPTLERLVQLAEEIPGGEFTVIEPLTFESQNRGNKKANSELHPPSTSFFAGSQPSKESHSSTKHKCHHHRVVKPNSSLSHLLNVGSTADTHPTIPGRCRPFDAILNFLPTGLSDKVLFKQTILVSTLCVQYLTLDASKPQPINSSGTSASRSDPTVDPSTARAPILYRRPTSSTEPSETTTTLKSHLIDSRFGRLFVSSPPHSPIAFDEKPMLRRRFSHFLGLSNVPNEPRGPRNSFDRLPVKAKREEDTSSDNSPPLPQKSHPSHLVHILPDSCLLKEATNKHALSPPSRRRTLNALPTRTTTRSRLGNIVQLERQSAAQKRRLSVPTPVLSSPSYTFVYAQVQRSLLRRASLQHAQDRSRRRLCMAPRERESNREKLLNYDGTNSKLVNCIEQFLMGYFGRSMPVVPYVVGTGLLGKKIPGTRAGWDESDCCSGSLTAGEILLLGYLKLDLTYGRRRCWIGGVDEFLVWGSERQGEGGAQTGEFVEDKDHHARRIARPLSPRREAEITTEGHQMNSLPDSKRVVEPRRPLPVACISSSSSISKIISAPSSRRNGFASQDVMSLSSPAASRAIRLKSPEAALFNPKSVGYSSSSGGKSSSAYISRNYLDGNSLSTNMPSSTVAKQDREWTTRRKGLEADVVGFNGIFRRLSFGLTKTPVTEAERNGQDVSDWVSVFVGA